MNRFQRKRTKAVTGRQLGIGAVVFFLIAGCMWKGILSVSATTSQQEKKTLERAISRDIVNCYALEGRYPESVEYMKSHYGLQYDEKKYMVDYEIIGANLMPDVTVLEKKGK